MICIAFFSFLKSSCWLRIVCIEWTGVDATFLQNHSCPFRCTIIHDERAFEVSHPKQYPSLCLLASYLIVRPQAHQLHKQYCQTSDQRSKHAWIHREDATVIAVFIWSMNSSLFQYPSLCFPNSKITLADCWMVGCISHKVLGKARNHPFLHVWHHQSCSSTLWFNSIIFPYCWLIM